MKIINKSKIPDALFRYLKAETYDFEAKGDSISVTDLLKPVQMVVLRRRHGEKLTVDALDRLWIMLGNGVHAILEKEEGIEKIVRLKHKVAGREVSGKWDRIFDLEITDYKVTSAWNVAFGSSEVEWMKQLSFYRWLYWKVKGVLLKETGKIVALLRDWDKKNVGKGNYPAQPAVEIPFALLSPEECEEIVERRVKAITVAEKLSDKKLPPCTPEERWWDENKKISRRCERYCEVASVCPQYALEKAHAGK